MQTNFLKTKTIIILVESTDNGRPAWWYVKCHNRISAEKLKGVCRLGNLDTIPLEEYGEIVLSGWGKNPPVEAIKHIEKQYS
jgi:hypothetical protein